MPRDFGHEGTIIGLDQQVAVVARQADTPVARDLLHDVGADIGRHIVLGELIELAQNFIGLQPGRGRIPQGERRDAVGVQIFGAFFQLGKTRQHIARIFIQIVLRFEQDGFIGLDDQRVLWIERHEWLVTRNWLIEIIPFVSWLGCHCGNFARALPHVAFRPIAPRMI